jgi:multiple sugar transport system ATP-binding protein
VEGVSGRALALGVRPEHVHLTDGGALRGEVLAAEYLGTTQIVTLRTKAGELKARVSSSLAVRDGETVGLAFDTAALALFDAGTGRAMALDRGAARRAAMRRAAGG